MTKSILQLNSAMRVIATMAATAVLSACSPADKTDTNASDGNTTVQTLPADENGNGENASGVAREMHNQMNEDQAMHDSMKGGAMADDKMGQMGPGGMNHPAMKSGQAKAVGDKPAADPAPKDKADPAMPMSDDMGM